MLRLTVLLLLLATVTSPACKGSGPAPTSTNTPAAAATSPSQTVAAGPVTIRLLPPSPIEPVVGQQFTIIIAIQGAANLGAYQLTPTYDRATLELISITDLGFLATTGRQPTCSQSGAPPDPVVQYCVTLGSEPVGPSGDGNLALLQFRALEAGTTEVGAEKVLVTSPDARDVPITMEPAVITVAP